MRRGVWWLWVLVAMLGVACSPSAERGSEGPLRVVATTTMLTDLVRQVGGDDVAVEGILKPGGDPHLYQPTPGDARLLASADVIVMNGLHLEGWMEALVRNTGRDARLIVAAEGVEPLKDPQRSGWPDPHVWHDAGRWSQVSEHVADELAAARPEAAPRIQARRDAWVKELAALDQEVRQALAPIPQEQRVLVTSHDAFHYYGKAYGLEVVAIQGISTESEAGARDLARVVDLVRARKIPAVFVESSVNPKLIEQLSRETGAKIGGTLYSDALGATPPEDTYTGMLRANTRAIATGLQPQGGATP